MAKILNKRDGFTVFDENVPVEKNWSDLKKIPQETINLLKKKYSYKYLEKIFASLYKLDIKLKKESNKALIENEINKAVQKAVNKVNKNILNEVNFILSMDPLNYISNSKGYFNSNLQKKLIESVADGNIIILDENMANSDWFKSLDLSKADDVRIYTPTNEYKTKKDNYTIYTSANNILKRNLIDEREIFVLGGELIFKETYSKATDLYISYLEDWTEYGDECFTSIEYNSFETVQCYVYEKERTNLSHLRKYKSRELKWKDSKIRYDVLNGISKKYKF